MSIIDKYEFITQFMVAFNKTMTQELKENLPDGKSFLYELQDKAWEIIITKGKHIQGGK